MNEIYWTADLETGFEDIDSQHKQLIFYINELQRVRGSGDQMLIAQTLFDLISCTMDHFSYEESVLEAAGYNLTEPHRNTHNNFTNRLLDFQSRIMAGEAVTEDLLHQLEAWIFRHIRINDQGYVAAVKASGLYEQDAQGIWHRTAEEFNSLPETAAAAEDKYVFTVMANEQETEKKTEQAAKSEEPKPRSWAGTY